MIGRKASTISSVLLPNPILASENEPTAATVALLTCSVPGWKLFQLHTGSQTVRLSHEVRADKQQNCQLRRSPTLLAKDKRAKKQKIFSQKVPRCWLGLIVTAILCWACGCQSLSTGLHDQLVRGSAVPEEEREYRSNQFGWLSGWMGRLRRTESAANIRQTDPRPVLPEDVTPATAWHTLQQLRAEIDRDRQDNGD